MNYFSAALSQLWSSFSSLMTQFLLKKKYSPLRANSAYCRNSSHSEREGAPNITVSHFPAFSLFKSTKNVRLLSGILIRSSERYLVPSTARKVESWEVISTLHSGPRGEALWPFHIKALFTCSSHLSWCSSTSGMSTPCVLTSWLVACSYTESDQLADISLRGWVIPLSFRIPRHFQSTNLPMFSGKLPPGFQIYVNISSLYLHNVQFLLTQFMGSWYPSQPHSEIYMPKH